MLRYNEHLKFLDKYKSIKDLDFYLTEPCRLNTLFWIINSYKILQKEIPNKKNIVKFVLDCKNADGGYGGSVGFPSTILTTFNALQILSILEEKFYDENTINFILKKHKEDGSFKNDSFDMSDNRINCSAILSLHLLYINCENKERDFYEPINVKFFEKIKFDYKKCINYIINCYNLDGGFGLEKNDESHCAFTFCCISSLRSLGYLDYINKRDISKFILLRQGKNGGFSGRIDKKEDVCYSFWAYATLIILKKDYLIDKVRLTNFILTCQSLKGGFSDRPGNEPDPYHLMFSLAALSLLNYNKLSSIDPGLAF
ncbi:geranylgeranyl transferase type ii beta subunit [Vairimorpha apis BRL 01]|uniref:Geranylgeranyl transferase type-2 subunit beta n=1 Tax=Vairimorpha apis BRL 01 TaxID=1037528 RepID=T0MDK2_9MICR|nr:geranylgeranyl transferase type ii beta subunit [Vairimorpha apis BRL 01]